ncbi:hypothetical protein GGI20_003596 [Coemansia sp. BCRC 34301]|nr:hypothetical protein GGI20_003596 [Coemansia sp. BCRC 34301]
MYDDQLTTPAGLLAELRAELHSHKYGIHSYTDPTLSSDMTAHTTLTLLEDVVIGVALSGSGGYKVTSASAEMHSEFVGRAYETLAALLLALSPAFNGAMNQALFLRLAAASAKYEPEDFRDNILQVIEDIAPTDYSKISSALDTAGNTLDYRRYGDTFFEVLVTGGIIAPGGIIEYDDERGKFAASLFVLATEEEMLAGAKNWTTLVVKLTRRYKYLERIFADTAKHILENIHRYSEADNKKLATGFGLLVSTGFLGMEPLRTLQKEHLTKDGLALRFFTDLLHVYLAENSAAQLGKALARAKLDQQLREFFPPNKRDDDCFERHFAAEEMPELVEVHRAARDVATRDAFVAGTVEMLRQAKVTNEDDSEDGVRAINRRLASHTKATMRTNKWDEHLAVVLAWDGIVGAVDWALRAEQIETQAINQIKRYAPVLEMLTMEPKSEVALLKHIQRYVYDDPKLTTSFGRIVFELYNADVLSSTAIIFWATKGARPEGKTTFLKQTEALVHKLQTLEREDDDEDDDDEDDED